MPGAPGLLEAATAVEHVLEVPEHELSRAEGDIHPYGNPHFMLDPRNALAVASLMANRLSELDPDGREVYERGAATFREKLGAKMTEWQERTAPHRGHAVVAYHKQWEYLADWLGMEIADYIESKAGIPPSPRHVASLIDRIRQEEIEIVLAATFVDVDAAEKVAERGGARLVILPAEVGGVDSAPDYFELMETIVTRIVGSHEE
jgi:zinc/manganese transport system substrate-binding protein